MDELRKHILRIDNLCTTFNHYQINSPPQREYHDRDRAALKRAYNSGVLDSRAITSHKFGIGVRGQQSVKDHLGRYQQLVNQRVPETNRNGVEEAPKRLAQPVSVIVTGDACRKVAPSSPSGSYSSNLPSLKSFTTSPKSNIPSPVSESPPSGSNSPSPVPNSSPSQGSDSPSLSLNAPSPNEESQVNFEFPTSRNISPSSSISTETSMEPSTKRSRKTETAAEQKDQKYWERRKRNNEAAKRSREARRLKEVEVSKRCDDLQQSNEELRLRIDDLQSENDKIEQTLRLYAGMLHNAQLIATKSNR